MKILKDPKRMVRMSLVALLQIVAVIFLASSWLPRKYNPVDGNYVIIAWNDLGMHCANQTFQKLVVLPPYNNLRAQAILKGNATNLPQILTGNYVVTYEIPGNTYSVGKTDFWSYEQSIFGVNLPDNIGLTGKGLTGSMDTTENFFRVEGIPITPFTDANLVTENPYQLALVKLFDGNGNLLSTTQPVVPVSNEIGCVSTGCHSSEQAILNQHTDDNGFNANNTPILCASCHKSNALGTAGQPGLASLSEVIHEKHASSTSNCYKCHPGANTQCFRDVMHSAGLVCSNCHGSMAQVAASISEGREPWLEEPSCGSTACHGSTYAEEPGKLYRNSRGHGGLFCSACHGSPHAILPTIQPNDNVQNIALQGFAGTLSNCSVCHGYTPQGPGPHNLLITDIHTVSYTKPTETALQSLFPNPVSDQSSLTFALATPDKTRIEILSLSGQLLFTLANRVFPQGQYSLELRADNLKPGAYLVRLSNSKATKSLKFLVIK